MKIIKAKKLLFGLLLIAAALFCHGCNDKPSFESDYRTGTQGIEVDFIANGVPDKIYEGMPLSLVAAVENKGAFGESYGRVYLRGFDPLIMPFEDLAVDGNYVEKGLPDVESKSAYMPEGGLRTLSFDIPENSVWLGETERYEPELMLSTCYYYETLATPTVCIVPDITKMTKRKLCNPEQPIRLDSQGGPVAVTYIEEQIMNDFVNFVITIKNLGDGVVVNADEASYRACPLELKTKNLNKVYVELDISNMPSPVCSPENYVHLMNNEGKISCRFQISPEQTPQFYANERTGKDTLLYPDEDSTTDMYTKQLNINLKYIYNTNVKKKIAIEKMPGTYTTGQEGQAYEDGGESHHHIDAPEKVSVDYECTCKDSDAWLEHRTDGKTMDAKMKDEEGNVIASGCVCLYVKNPGDETFRMYPCNLDNFPDAFVKKDGKMLLRSSDPENMKNCALIYENSQLFSGTCNTVFNNPFQKNGEKTTYVKAYGEPGASQLCTIGVIE